VVWNCEKCSFWRVLKKGRENEALIIIRSRPCIGGGEIRERCSKVDVCDWGTICEFDRSDNSVTFSTDSQVSIAEDSHCDSEDNIDDVITRSSSVGITSNVTTDNSEGVLRSTGDNINRGVEAEEIDEFGTRFQIVESGNSSEESGDKIGSGEVGWGNGREVRSED